MYPKSEIQSLNLRREINSRLRFLKQRMVESAIEHHYWGGTIPELPEGMRQPPEWAKEAAYAAWEQGLGIPFRHISKEGIKQDPRGSVKELIGIYESMLAFVANPRPEEADPEVREAAVKLRRFASKIVAKKLIQYLKKLEANIDRLLPAPTQAELVAIGERYTRGLRSANENDDSFLGIKTTTSKIYYLIWLFWPKLEARSSLTAKDLRDWLSKDFGLHSSDKLAESVHTKLRLSRYKKPGLSKAT